MKSKVAKILPSESDSSLAGAVVLGDGGPTLPADFVIMGVGVAPATGFLKESGFTLERDGGVRVDEFLRVLGLDGSVYAIGRLRCYSHSKSGLTHCRRYRCLPSDRISGGRMVRSHEIPMCHDANPEDSTICLAPLYPEEVRTSTSAVADGVDLEAGNGMARAEWNLQGQPQGLHSGRAVES